MSLKIDAAVYSHIGGRSNNEDNFYFNGVFMSREQTNSGGELSASSADKSQIYAVCDGMGGAEYGEEASLRTVTELKKYQKDCQQPDSSVYLDKLIDDTSRKVDEISLSKGMPSGSSGSTIAMMIINDYYYRTVHVGDSRIYRLRGGKLERLTRDDSEVQRMLDNGQITAEQAWRHPKSNINSKHLGMPLGVGKTLKPTISSRNDLVAGDRYILCSDGLSDVVRDSQIAKTGSGGTPREAAERLVFTALQEANGYGVSSDNITVIVMDVCDVGNRQQAARHKTVMRAIQIASGVLMALSASGIAFLVTQLFMR